MFKAEFYELNLMLKMKMRMASIQTMLNMRIILNMRTVLNVGKKSLLFPGSISQGHNGCANKKGQLKMVPLSGVSHLMHT